MEELSDKIKEFRKSTLKKSGGKEIIGEGGKLPPQAVDLEEAVLGAMMLDAEAVNSAIDVLKPESFYKTAHQKIFLAIQQLFQEAEQIDILTVTNQLRKNGDLEAVGGPYYISQLTQRVGSAANVEIHSRIISQKYILRELIRVSSQIITEAFEETTDVFDLLDKAEGQLFAIAEGNIRKNYDKMKDLLVEAIDNIQKAKEQEDGVSGVPSGFTALDRITSGWQKQDLVIVAARPGMGKTSFVLSMARNITVDFKRPVAVFSLEMSSIQLVNRLISSETGLSSEKLRKGQLKDHEWQQLNSRITNLSDAPLFIDDTPSLSVFELRAKCRRLKAQHDIELIIIDYLQLMTAGGEGRGNREQEISTISRSIKSIAKELDVPIIALSQLSRAVESRGGDKRPQLSDLRESGAIEQDADLVSFIYRPEYYNIPEYEDGAPTEGTGTIIIAKHRNGALDDVKLRFINNLAKFDNLDQFEADSFNAANNLGPNTDFDAGNSITRPSKMNDDNDFDDDFNIGMGDGDDHTPF